MNRRVFIETSFHTLLAFAAQETPKRPPLPYQITHSLNASLTVESSDSTGWRVAVGTRPFTFNSGQQEAIVFIFPPMAQGAVTKEYPLPEVRGQSQFRRSVVVRFAPNGSLFTASDISEIRGNRQRIKSVGYSLDNDWKQIWEIPPPESPYSLSVSQALDFIPATDNLPIVCVESFQSGGNIEIELRKISSGQPIYHTPITELEFPLGIMFPRLTRGTNGEVLALFTATNRIGEPRSLYIKSFRDSDLSSTSSTAIFNLIDPQGQPLDIVEAFAVYNPETRSFDVIGTALKEGNFFIFKTGFAHPRTIPPVTSPEFLTDPGKENGQFPKITRTDKVTSIVFRKSPILSQHAMLQPERLRTGVYGSQVLIWEKYSPDTHRPPILDIQGVETSQEEAVVMHFAKQTIQHHLPGNIFNGLGIQPIKIGPSLPEDIPNTVVLGSGTPHDNGVSNIYGFNSPNRRQINSNL